MRLPQWLCEDHRGVGSEPISAGFADKNLARIRAFVEELLKPEGEAKAEGLVQSLSAGARVGGFMVLALSAVLLSNALALVALGIVVAGLAAVSGLNPFRLFKRRVLTPLIFTAIIMLPLLFLDLSGGDGYSIGLTEYGTGLFVLMLLRVSVATFTIAVLVGLTTEQELFSGLGALPVPSVVVAMLYMSLRQIVLFTRLAENINLARKSRTIRPALLKDEGQWFASRLAYFLRRAFQQSREVAMAMVSRGFRGELKTNMPAPMGGRDYIFMGFCFFIFFLSLGL